MRELEKMCKKITLLYKFFVIGIIILLAGMSIVSSSIKIVDENIPINKSLNFVNNPADRSSCDHLGYVLGFGGNCFLYSFMLNDASDLTCVYEGNGSKAISATWTNENHLYFINEGLSGIIGFDKETGEIWSLGGGINFRAITYDQISEKIFACSDSDYLFMADPKNGETEQIGSISGGVGLIRGMAFDPEGVLYAWDQINDALWIIDTETAEATKVGSLGIHITHYCDGDFCNECDILYLVFFNNLYICDKTTGQCYLVPNGSFPDYVWITALAIPYDNTPPVTNHNLDPPEPDGENGWYVSNVTVTLNATDNVSGVNITYYRVNNSEWKEYEEPFIIFEDGNDNLIEYYSVDYSGNVEDVKSFIIDIDQTEPDVALTYEIVGGNKWQGWDYEFMAHATEKMSGMDYVVFYMNYLNTSTVYGSGPEYIWAVTLPGFLPNIFKVRGLIYNLEIDKDYVKFNALIVRVSRHYQRWSFPVVLGARGYDKAGNKGFDEVWGDTNTVSITPGIYILKNIVIPNNYFGIIGNNFIFATFNLN
jgi:hypothetical protein